MTELDTAAQSRINERIALLIGAKRAQVQAAVDLLDEGATVPFIARYRKEATGGSMTRSCVICRKRWCTGAKWKNVVRR